LDILIDPCVETTLFNIGAIRQKIKQLLGVPVDVLTPNALPEKVSQCSDFSSLKNVSRDSQRLHD
jgi:predicted nucleotidyltransferase